MDIPMHNIYVKVDRTLYSFGVKSLYSVDNIDIDDMASDDILVVEKDPVFYANIAITNNCNLACKHCLCNTTSRGHAHEEFTREEVVDLVGMLYAQGLSCVSLTGGEPFLCKNIFVWLDEMKKYGIDTKISTNATLLDEATVERLVSYENVTEIDISISGYCDDSGTVYNVRNSIPEKMKNVKCLLERNRHADIFMSSVLTKHVLDNLEGMEAQIYELGIGAWKLKDMHVPHDKIDSIPDELFPRLRDVIDRLDAFIKKRRYLDVIGYLVEYARDGDKKARCADHAQRGLYISYNKIVLWMHAFNIVLGRLGHNSIPELAGTLTGAIEQNQIPARCEKCSSRAACLVSPFCGLNN